MEAFPVWVYFGAFDRHNFGDLLLARVVPEVPGPRIWAGLVSRDLSPLGGVACLSLAELGASWQERFGEAPARLIHVGGEILTTTAWEAAVMLQTEDEAARAIARWERHPVGRESWVKEQLGCSRAVPYVAGKEALPRVAGLEFWAVGGVALDRLAPAAKAEVLAALSQTDHLGVRDKATRDALIQCGLAPVLEPDRVSSAMGSLVPLIERHCHQGEPALVRERFPQGYVAFQCSGDFGTDAMVDDLARGLRHRLQGRGLVLFRAGAAPWHDQLELYQRLLSRVDGFLFESLHVGDIGALVAGAGLVCASSLHVRLVARAFGVAVQSLAPDSREAARGKVASWLATWEGGEGGVMTPREWAGS